MPRAADPGLTVQQLQRLLTKRQSEITRLQRQRSAIQRRLDAVDRRIESLTGGRAARATGGGPGTRVRNQKSLAEVMREVLENEGKPMKVGDIAQAVTASGYKSNSGNFRAIVNQMLIKDKRFTSPRRTFYQLRK